MFPFRLNGGQKPLHARLDRQLAEECRVRDLVLKARQPGVSTYVAGRFFWTVTHRKGVRAFTPMHKGRATTNLSGMAMRFEGNCTSPIRPQIEASNAKEVGFDRVNSGYRVGTAKAQGACTSPRFCTAWG